MAIFKAHFLPAKQWLVSPGIGFEKEFIMKGAFSIKEFACFAIGANRVQIQSSFVNQLPLIGDMEMATTQGSI